MHLKQLAYFLAITEAQSFSRAAIRLRVTQPALSRQMKELEGELGAPLFERHARGLSLTAAGQILRDRATHILNLSGTVKDEIAATMSEPSGNLVVALPAAFRVLITTKLVCEFKRLYPQVRLCVLELTTVERRESVVTGHADLAVITTVEPDDELSIRPLVNESLFIVGPPERKFRASRIESLEYVAKLPLVQNTRPNAMRLIFEKSLSRAGLTSRTEIEADALDMMFELVAAGPYCIVAPYSSIHNLVETRKLSAAPIASLAVTWQVVVSSSRAVSVAAKTFEEMLVSVCKGLIQTGKWQTAKFLYQ